MEAEIGIEPKDRPDKVGQVWTVTSEQGIRPENRCSDVVTSKEAEKENRPVEKEESASAQGRHDGAETDNNIAGGGNENNGTVAETPRNHAEIAEEGGNATPTEEMEMENGPTDVTTPEEADKENRPATEKSADAERREEGETNNNGITSSGSDGNGTLGKKVVHPETSEERGTRIAQKWIDRYRTEAVKHALVRPFFTKEAWDKMHPDMKTMHGNVYRNYLMTLDLGLPVHPPPFAANQLQQVKATWNKWGIAGPSSENQVPPKRQRKRKAAIADLVPTRESLKRSCKKPRVEAATTTETASQGKKARNPCRKLTKVSDGGIDHVYCAICKTWRENGCQEHPLKFVSDNPRAIAGKRRFARDSCPDGIVLKESKIRGAGIGVWASTKFVPPQAFGPYQGEKSYAPKKKKKNDDESGYAWEIFIGGDRWIVDGRREKTGNWMRYVNDARGT